MSRRGSEANRGSTSHREEFKVVIVGDRGCGKTSLLKVYTTGDFPEVSTHWLTCFSVNSSKSRDGFCLKSIVLWRKNNKMSRIQINTSSQTLRVNVFIFFFQEYVPSVFDTSVVNSRYRGQYFRLHLYDTAGKLSRSASQVWNHLVEQVARVCGRRVLSFLNSEHMKETQSRAMLSVV